MEKLLLVMCWDKEEECYNEVFVSYFNKSQLGIKGDGDINLFLD